VDDRLDVEVHHRRCGPGLDCLLVLAVEVAADVERGESDGNRRDNAVARGVKQVARPHRGAAGGALVEDDHAGRTGGLSVEDLHPEEARTALDQSDPARYEAVEVIHGAAAGRTGGRRRWDDNASGRLKIGRRATCALPGIPFADDRVAV